MNEILTSNYWDQLSHRSLQGEYWVYPSWAVRTVFYCFSCIYSSASKKRTML